jgi:hypothetical protein
VDRVGFEPTTSAFCGGSLLVICSISFYICPRSLSAASPFRYRRKYRYCINLIPIYSYQIGTLPLVTASSIDYKRKKLD